MNVLKSLVLVVSPLVSLVIDPVRSLTDPTVSCRIVCAWRLLLMRHTACVSK